MGLVLDPKTASGLLILLCSVFVQEPIKREPEPETVVVDLWRRNLTSGARNK
jgi:hypothetical protein